MHKYKVGDRVQVLDEVGNHGFNVGDSVRVKSCFIGNSGDFFYRVEDIRSLRTAYIREESIRGCADGYCPIEIKLLSNMTGVDC